MTVIRVLCAAFGVSLALALASPAMAQGSGEEDEVVARVNGYEIRASEVRLASDDIVAQLEQVPPRLRYPFVVQYLIERHLLAQQAVQQGLDRSAEYRRRLAFYQAKALRDAFFHEEIRAGIAEEELREIYEREAAQVADDERVRVRHILVQTEAEAQQLRQQIEEGANFEELARAHSRDGSAEFGGDLGFFRAEEMVPEFSRVAFEMDEGTVSDPVRTQYGWHLIQKIAHRRGAEPFEQVRDAIELILLRMRVQERVDELRESGNVELVDPDLKEFEEQIEAQRQEMLRQQQEQQLQPQ